MKNICLLRHAKSSWADETLADFDRPLNKRGRDDAQRVGKWLEDWFRRNERPPKKVLVSPALRTRQTLAETRLETSFPEAEIVWADAIYEASSDTLRALILERFRECDSLMLIGHNPGLDMLLLETDPAATRFVRNNKLMTTATFCAVEIDVVNFNDVKLEGRAVEFVRPKYV